MSRIRETCGEGLVGAATSAALFSAATFECTGRASTLAVSFATGEAAGTNADSDAKITAIRVGATRGPFGDTRDLLMSVLGAVLESA